MRYLILVGALILSLPGTAGDFAERVARARPLELVVAWNTIDKPLPGMHGQKVNAPDLAARPTADFLDHAHRITVAVNEDDQGAVWTPATDLIFRITSTGGTRRQATLVLDGRDDDGRWRARTTVVLRTNQWLNISQTIDHRRENRAIADGTAAHASYRYVFACLGQSSACYP